MSEVFLPKVTKEMYDQVVETAKRVLEATGLEDGVPDECLFATFFFNIAINGLDENVAASLDYWAKHPEQGYALLNMSYVEFHQHVLHILVRLAFAHGFVIGQNQVMSEMAQLAAMTLDEQPEVVGKGDDGEVIFAGSLDDFMAKLEELSDGDDLDTFFGGPPEKPYLN